MSLRNWAGNVTYAASNMSRPDSVDELQDLVAHATSVKALGSGHAFTTLADTTGELISMAGLNRVVSLDLDARTITVEGGMTYGDLTPILRKHHLAIPNLASLPHISIAGACATGTHGSGVANQNLSMAVHSMEFVRADGTIGTISRAVTDFAGTVVHLGALGIVARITLDLVPEFMIAQTVYEDLPWTSVETHLEEILGGAYSVSLFTHWVGDAIHQVWVKRLGEAPSDADYFGATAADGPRHPIAGMPSEYCTEQQGIAGPWDERLCHFRKEFTPSSGEELQSEYFVPREQALEALKAIRAMGEEIAPHLHVSEIRTIAADPLWLSPAYERDSVAIHFTWRAHPAEVQALLPRIEKALGPFGARPHWGKLFTMDRRQLANVYERVYDVKVLAELLDPAGKFRNGFLGQTLGLLPVKP